MNISSWNNRSVFFFTLLLLERKILLRCDKMKLWISYITYIHSPLCIQSKNWGQGAIQEQDPTDTMNLYLCEKVGDSSGSAGSSRNTASSSGLPESPCMALRGRVKSLSQLSFGGVQGTGLVQWGRKGKWRADKSLHPKHSTTYKTDDKYSHFLDSGLNYILNFCWLADLVKAAAVKGFIRHITWQTEASVSAASVTIR